MGSNVAARGQKSFETCFGPVGMRASCRYAAVPVGPVPPAAMRPIVRFDESKFPSRADAGYAPRIPLSSALS